MDTRLASIRSNLTTETELNNALNLLKLNYHLRWPVYSDLDYLIKLFELTMTPQQLNRLIENFKNYIESQTNAHYARQHRQHLFLDCYSVKKTFIFKKLVNNLSTLLKQSSQVACAVSHTWGQQLSGSYHVIGSFVKYSVMGGCALFAGLMSYNYLKADDLSETSHDYLKPDTLSEVPEAPKYHFTEVSGLCGIKGIGASEGRICFHDGAYVFLKTIKDAKSNKGNDPLLGEFNLRFLKETLNVEVPEMRFYKINNSDAEYVGSKFIDFLYRADNWCITRDLDCIYDRAISSYLNTTARAQLFVANTFIKDLTSNNWGVTDNRVVIIDSDQSPANLNEYFSWAANRFKHNKAGSIGFALTIEEIKEMKKIYHSMLMRKVPERTIPLAIDQVTYEILVKTYIEICDETITKVEANNCVVPDAPDLNINTVFSEAIRNQIKPPILSSNKCNRG